MLQIVISIIFYLTFILYAFLGVFCLTLNKKAQLNRSFFYVCLSFAIWSYAFAISNSLNNIEHVLIWRRVASLGWGVAFSCILHFILILTENEAILKNRFVFGALYIPAAVTVFIFGIDGNLAPAQYNLVHTQVGWGNIPVNNIWDIFYNLYYISYALLALFLLWKWHQDVHKTAKRRQAFYLLLSFSMAIVIGTGSEMLANSYLAFKLPSIAPIIILIPVITFAYNIKKFALMAPAKSKKTKNVSDVLSDHTHSTFVRYIAIIYLCVSVFNVLQCFFYPSELWTDMIFATIFVAMGLIIYNLTASSLTIRGQDRMMTVIIAITIPLTIFRFYDTQMSEVLWTLPLIYLMMTIVFNYQKMFGIIAFVSIAVGAFLLIMMPENQMDISAVNYMGRLIIYLIAIVLAAFVNRIYIMRLKENEQQIQFQKMLTNITTNFVAVNRHTFDDKVKDLLRQSGSFANADRVYICVFSKDGMIFNHSHRWVAENVERQSSDTDICETFAWPWSKEQLLNNQIIYIPDRESLPPEAKNERDELLSKQIQSIIAVPICSKAGVIGFIGFDHLTKERIWQIDDYEKLRMLAKILANAMAKVETEKEMNDLAFYDTLTKLPNRVLFENRLKQALELAKLQQQYLGIVFLDIDEFKEVNDTLGHDIGDYLIKEIGERLSCVIWQQDTLARFGGDEFLILFPRILKEEELSDYAKKIMAVFHQPVLVGEQEFHITASGGISVFPRDGETVNDLIKHADLAMYVAKSKGKGQVVFCTDFMKQDVLEKMILSNSLYQALEREEFFIEYQPQVSIKSNEIVGFEVLLGWQHPKLGLISPAVFVPIAEQTGLINSIGEWLLLNACAQNKTWQDKGFKPVKMAINLALEQFRSLNVVAIVEACLAKTGMDSKYLELEINERIAMRRSNDAIKCLNDLNKMGVTISIADFGTEVSSLSRLKDLPIDRLKIDRQFINGIGLNDKDESIVSIVIFLAKRLGIKVIAEGVETEQQLAFLSAEKCDESQGHYFYKPLSNEEIEKHCASQLVCRRDGQAKAMSDSAANN